MPLLADALQELSTALNVLYTTTQGKLLTHLDRQLTRLDHCEGTLRLVAQRNDHVLKGLRQRHEQLDREHEEHLVRTRKLQQRMQRERLERTEEREWLASLWPEGVVLPTLLRPFVQDEDRVAPGNEVEARDQRRRLQALVNRRVAKERVLQQLEIASQWKVVLVPPSTGPAGEFVAGQLYYQHTVTGESLWEPPAAMFYEPPAQWDLAKMDWRDSHGLEHFYPPDDDDGVPNSSVKPTAGGIDIKRGLRDDDEDEDEGEGSSDDVDATPRSKDQRESDDEDNDAEGNAPVDPVALRQELTEIFEKEARIRAELEQTLTQERVVSLQLLNASRDCFEQEKEQLATEDEEKKDVERRKRKAKLQEEAAAKAAAEAQERKANKTIQPKFGRDSVGKKDMVLSKDEELFEKEIHEYIIAQRADRRYLAAPLSRDERVKLHRQQDEEYVHMKLIEQQVLQIEQFEFDLLEKTALRQEEATKKLEELCSLLEQSKLDQLDTDDELRGLQATIASLETPRSVPSDPRPSADELQRARSRFLVPEEDSEVNGDENTERDDDGMGAAENRDRDMTQQNAQKVERHSSVVAQMTAEEAAAFLRDEAELKQFKRYVDAENQWNHWELEEIARLENLAAAYDRFQILEATKRRLVVDVALFEADRQFFESLVTREKDINERMWKSQALSQVERTRFLIERAAREEAVFQIQDAYEVLKLRLEDAKRLPLQARNPLEKIELIEESKAQAKLLEEQVESLQKRFAKEFEAQTLLVDLEKRFCTYSLERLQEEVQLFNEKQTLWDQNFSLLAELQGIRSTIEMLFESLSGQNPESPPDAAAKYAEAIATFDEKLKLLESVRQFLLLCYDRESRWRSIASISLIKDTSSDEWMTTQQRERQDEMLAALQQDHDHELLSLRKEIKLLKKIQDHLQDQIREGESRIERLRREYQATTDAVRVETEQIVLGLKDALFQEEKQHELDIERAKAERERLMKEHEEQTTLLELRIVDLQDENEQQWHWLTAAKRELHAQRVANEELLMGYQSLEKRRAAETNDMRFRITSQIRKINNIEMWNLSLKIQAREAHAERVHMQKEIERLIQHHKQQQRLLRLENWKQRVTAQAILTDADALFEFFAHGLEILAGATTLSNAAVRRNGGVEILAALAQHSCQAPIRVIAAKALGQLGWNTNVAPRSLGWKAKRTWFQWVDRRSKQILSTLASQQMEFDSAAPESGTEMNWLADTSDFGGRGETDSDLHERKTKKILFLRTWNARDDIERPDVNHENQEYIGLAPSVLKTMIDLCHDPPKTPVGLDDNDARRIQSNALRSLAIIVMNTRNTAIIGRMDGCIPLLVSLLGPHDEAPHSRNSSPMPMVTGAVRDPHVVRNAIQALANLAYENLWNQTQICSAGAIPPLLAFCRAHTDVDVLVSSVHALSNLSYEHVRSCEVIFDTQGIAILTGLCHSTRIHDAIDLDVFEEIQTRAAEVISNVITMLDVDQPPQEPQQQDLAIPTPARDVANAILTASELEAFGPTATPGGAVVTARRPAGAPPGVATFVLMCASCNRDVAFHGALVLGSIAQHDDIRAAIGNAGGIDALFLLAGRREDPGLMAQATWALANSTWNRENQYRVARYLEALYRICTYRAVVVGSRPHHDRDDDDGTDHQDPRDGNQSIEVPPHDDEGERAAWAEQIREHGLCILANALFYNDANRQLVASETRWMTLLEHQCRHGRGHRLEHAARALCALSYSDAIAVAMGGGLEGVPKGSPLGPAAAVRGLEVFVRLCGHAPNPLVQKHGLFGLINMVLHDGNKTRLLEVPRGIETLVNLSGHANAELAEPALEALDILADLRVVKEAVVGSSPTAVLSPSAMSALAATDLTKLVALLRDPTTSPGLVAMASDAIADEVWKKPSAKVKLRNEHGLDQLLALCVAGTTSTDAATQLRVLGSCLWALRNAIADNVRNQDHVGALDGVPKLIALYDRHRQHEDIVEAILATLVALVLQHPRNSQELVQVGIDALVALADGHIGNNNNNDDENERSRGSAGGGGGGGNASDSRLRLPAAARTTSVAPAATALGRKRQGTNAGLARELLHVVAPYNTSSPTLPPLLHHGSSPDKARMKKPLTTMTTVGAAPGQHLPPVPGAVRSPRLSPTRSSHAVN